MDMPITVDVDVVCEQHPQKPLYGKWNTQYKELRIDPCEDCLEEAKERGRKEAEESQ